MHHHALPEGEVNGLSVVPIPGTSRREWLEENTAAADVRLTQADLDALEPLATQVAGTNRHHTGSCQPPTGPS